MMVKAMRERGEQGRELGPGERAERAKRRRFWLPLVLLALVGGVTGGIIGAREGDAVAAGRGFLEGNIAPELAVTLTALFLISTAVGTYYMLRQIDEHTMREQLWFSSYGATAFVIAYPAWFLLWKGGLLPEPHHLALFLIFYAGAFIGYAVRYLLQRR